MPSTSSTDSSPQSSHSNGAATGSSEKHEANSSKSGHTSVFLVDDHPSIRNAVHTAIEEQMDLEVVGEAAELEEILDQIEACMPDVLVVDISLPDGHGIDLIQAISEAHPDIVTLVFSMYDETVYAERALRAGASGYLMKTESLDCLVEAVRRVERGEIYLSRSMATQVLSGSRGGGTPSFAIDELTDRELQVFRLLGRGNTVQEIQEQLDLSRKTVETYRRRAKEKLGVESVSELLQQAVQWTYLQQASHLDEPMKGDAAAMGEG